jgi:hypothetical protein
MAGRNGKGATVVVEGESVKSASVFGLNDVDGLAVDWKGGLKARRWTGNAARKARRVREGSATTMGPESSKVLTILDWSGDKRGHGGNRASAGQYARGRTVRRRNSGREGGRKRDALTLVRWKERRRRT